MHPTPKLLKQFTERKTEEVFARVDINIPGCDAESLLNLRTAKQNSKKHYSLWWHHAGPEEAEESREVLYE